MERPIRESPVLKGEDTFNFEMRRLEVENMSKEQRAENLRKVEEGYACAKSYINFICENMDLIELTPDYSLSDFDCGDEQLNKFLFEDVKPSLALRVANTFVLVDDGRIAQ